MRKRAKVTARNGTFYIPTVAIPCATARRSCIGDLFYSRGAGIFIASLKLLRPSTPMSDCANSATRSSCNQIRTTGMRVALLEDDASHAELFSHWLASAGFLCSQYARGQSLLRVLRQESFDFLVLDWILPDISGVDVLRHVRGALQSPIPVLLISARAREADIVTALRQGADDYIVKPVRRLEFVARLEALGRRRGMSKPAQPEVIEVGALRIDCQSRTAWREHRSIHLTAKQVDLAVLFLLNIGRLLSRGEVQEAVWGPDGVPSSRTLDTYISCLRDKLGLTPSNGWRLAAVYGHGYRLEEVTMPARPAGGVRSEGQENPRGPQLQRQHDK